jgi:hypothetical protein
MGLFNFGKAKKRIDPMEVPPEGSPLWTVDGWGRGQKDSDLSYSTDSIKGAFFNNVNLLTLDRNHDIVVKNHRYTVNESIYSETNSFYNTNMRTSLGVKLMKMMVNQVFDTNTKLIINGKESKEVVYKGQKVDFNLNHCKTILTQLNLQGKCGILIRPSTGTYKVDAVAPWKYTIDEKEIVTIALRNLSEKDYTVSMGYGKSDEIKVKLSDKDEKIVKDSVMFFEVRGEKLFTDGVLEYLLLYSEMMTSIQHENKATMAKIFTTKGMLSDTELKSNRSYYIPVVNVDANSNLTGTDSNKPLFEVVTPSIRFDQYLKGMDIVCHEIASILDVDPTLVASSMNATTAISIDSKTASTINDKKAEVEHNINNLLETLFGEAVRVQIEPMELQSKEAKVKNGVVLLGANASTSLQLIRELNPNWTEKEIMIEYLKCEIKASKPLTEDEKELAIKYKLQTEEEEQLPEEPAPVEEGMTSDKIDNATKVNTQGVSTAAEVQSDAK